MVRRAHHDEEGFIPLPLFFRRRACPELVEGRALTPPARRGLRGAPPVNRVPRVNVNLSEILSESHRQVSDYSRRATLIAECESHTAMIRLVEQHFLQCIEIATISRKAVLLIHDGFGASREMSFAAGQLRRKTARSGRVFWGERNKG